MISSFEVRLAFYIAYGAFDTGVTGIRTHRNIKIR